MFRPLFSRHVSAAALVLASFASFAPLAVQSRLDADINARIRQEENYERVIEDDVKASAIAIAATLYQLAMRDEMLPAAQMPPLPTRP
jgi:hypothetical protein